MPGYVIVLLAKGRLKRDLVNAIPSVGRSLPEPL